jgi:hypothetical protein
MKRTVLALVIALGSYGAAEASCRCVCVNGAMQAVCYNSSEPEPPCPGSYCPPVPGYAEPPNRATLPPVGTTSCSNQMVLNPYTHAYEWRQLCR